jgi:hypothetical protein
MSFEARDAVRRNSRLLAAISGPTGSGKTYSALRVATGLADGGPLVLIDTERGRALDYADSFVFKHIDFDEPHSPQRYIEALDAAEALNPSVVILDSASHEWAGVGGATEMHDAIVERIAGDDYKKREAVSWGAWNKPKQEDRRFISRLTRMRCHVIVCLRAEEKTEMIDDPDKPGKKKVVPKRLLSGHVGWIPVTGKALPYEFTISLVVTPDAPGVPHPIKLPEPLKPFVPLDQPISEETGARLGEWARGGSGGPVGGQASPAKAQEVPVPPDIISAAQRKRLFAIAAEQGVTKEHVRDLVKELTGGESTAELSVEHYETLVGLIESRETSGAAA